MTCGKKIEYIVNNNRSCARIKFSTSINHEFAVQILIKQTK